MKKAAERKLYFTDKKKKTTLLDTISSEKLIINFRSYAEWKANSSQIW